MCQYLLTHEHMCSIIQSVQHSNKETLTQTEERVGTTLRVPKSLWKRLRNAATDMEINQEAIWFQALTEFLERQDKAKRIRQKGAA